MSLRRCAAVFAPGRAVIVWADGPPNRARSADRCGVAVPIADSLKLLMLLALAILVAFAAGSASAQTAAPQGTETAMRDRTPSDGLPATPEPQPVRIEFTVCEVAARPGPVDEECSVFQHQVHYSFGTMILREQQVTDIELGGAAELSVGGDSLLEVMPISVLGPRLNMQVQMPGIVNARVQLMLGRSAIFVGQHNGTNLLIGVRPAFEPFDPSSSPRLPGVLASPADPRDVPPSQRPGKLPEARRAGSSGTSGGR
jgi:hypothetical protein